MKFLVFSLFPELVAEALARGVVGQAIKRGAVQLELRNPRAFASGIHQAVDDRPFGGGDGMVMSAEIGAQALAAEGLPDQQTKIICLSARGRPFNDALAREWAADGRDLALFCGRYGGIDQRLVENFAMDEVALGDFVLSGGELAAAAMIDAVARLLPGTLGNEASAQAESFSEGLLEEPQFTRPREWRGMVAPEALLSGDHARVARWREDFRVIVTAAMRPDLLASWRPENAPARLARALARLNEASAADLQSCGVRDPQAARNAIAAALRLGEEA